MKDKTNFVEENNYENQIYLDSFKCTDQSKKGNMTLYRCECPLFYDKVICEECKEVCHSKCSTKIKIFDSFDYKCECLENNHDVLHEDPDKRLFNAEITKRCPYTEHFKDDLKFYKKDNLTFCSICLDNCQKFVKNEFEESSLKQCNCLNHNRENLHQDLIHKGVKFNEYIPNYNLNYIFNKFQSYTENLKDMLIKKRPIDYENDFFVNKFLVQFIQIYFDSNRNYNNRFFSMMEIFDRSEMKTTVLNIIEKSKTTVTTNYVEKFLFASFMTQYYLIEPYKNLYRHYPLLSIINMNPIQRNKHIYNMVSLKSNSDEKDSFLLNSEADNNKFYDHYLSLFKSILKGNSKNLYSIKLNFIKHILPNFTTISLFLIKHRIISFKHTLKFFKNIFYAIKSFVNLNEEIFILEEEFNFTIYTLVKTVFVTLLYINDMTILEKIEEKGVLNNLKNLFFKEIDTYAFTSSQTEIICKVFLSIVNKVKLFNTQYSNTGLYILKLYLYNEKIFDLMIGDNFYYQNCIKNLGLLPSSSFDNFYYKVDLTSRFIFTFSTEIDNLSLQFILCNLSFKDYITRTYIYCNKLIEKFYDYIGLTQIVDSTKRFVKLLKLIKKGSNTMNTTQFKNLRKLQFIANNSNFFSSLAKFFSIIYNDKKVTEEDIKIFKDENNLSTKILFMIYLMVYKNMENFVLMGVIEFEHALFIFEDIPIKDKGNENKNKDKDNKNKRVINNVFTFFKKIGKLTLLDKKNKYFFDNMEIIFKITYYLLIKVNDTFDLKNILKISTENIESYCETFNWSAAFLLMMFRQIGIFQIYRAGILELFFVKLKLLNINNESLKIIIENQNLKASNKFLYNYLKLLNEIVDKGLGFLGLLNLEPIFSKLDLYNVIKIFNSSTKLKFKIKIELVRYALVSKFNSTLLLKNHKSIFKSSVAKKYIDDDYQPFMFFDITNNNKVDKKNHDLVLHKANISHSYSKINFDDERVKLFLDIYDILKYLLCSSDNFFEMDDPDNKLFKFKIFYFEQCLLRPSYMFLKFKSKFGEIKELEYNLLIFKLLFNKCKQYDKFTWDPEKRKHLKIFVEIDENLEKEIDCFQDRYIQYIGTDKISDYLTTMIKVNLNEKKEKEDYDVEEKNDTNEHDDETNEDIDKDFVGLEKLKEGLNEEEKINFILNKKYLQLNSLDINQDLVLKLRKIDKNFRKHHKQMFGNNLSMIRVLDEIDINYSEELFYHFLNKLSKTSTTQNDQSLKFEFSNARQSSALIFLNKIFYHSNKKFQAIINKNTFKANFINCLISKLIFPTFMFHLSKFDEIETDYKKFNIVSDILAISLQILKKMCEENNLRNQTILFGLSFDKSDFKSSLKELKNSLKTTHNIIDKKRFSNTNLSNFEININEKRKLSIENKQEIKTIFHKLSNKVLVNQTNRKISCPEINIPEANLNEDSHLNFINFIFKSLRLLYFHSREEKKITINKSNYLYRMIKDIDDLLIEMIMGTHPGNISNLFSISNEFFHNYTEICVKTQSQFLLYINDIRMTLFKNEVDIFRKKHDSTSDNELYFMTKFNSKLLNEHFRLLSKLVLIFDPNRGQNLELVQNLLLAYPPKLLMYLISKSLILLCHINKIEEIDNPFIMDESYKAMPLSEEKSFFSKKNFKGIYKWLIKFLKSNKNSKKKINSRSRESNKYNEEIEEDDNDTCPIFKKFKKDPKFSESIYFKLGCEIFMFIKILNDKYDLPNIKDIFSEGIKQRLEKMKSIIKIKIELNLKKALTYKRKNAFNMKDIVYKRNYLSFSEYSKDIFQNSEKLEEELAIEGFREISLKITKFYNRLFRECEFYIPNYDEEKEVKKMYFFEHSLFYMLMDRNHYNFLQNINRKNSFTKLKGFLNYIEEQCLEIKYKMKFSKNPIAQDIMDFNQESVDFINVVFSSANIFLVFYLARMNSLNHLPFYFYLFQFIQIIFNLFILFSFIIVKYKFFVKLNKAKMKLRKDKTLSLAQKLDLYIVKSFLFNEAYIYSILNIYISKSLLVQTEKNFLCYLQILLIILHFEKSFEFINIFKSKIDQIFSLFLLLFILIYFYTNLTFFNFSEEFVNNIIVNYF